MNWTDWVYASFFYLIAGVALLGAAITVFAPRIVYNAIALVVTFLSIAGIFILLNADFIAAAQIIIYGVGVTILLIFAIMLTGKEEDKKLWIAFAPRTLIILGCAGMFFLIGLFGISNKFTGLSDKAGIFKIQTPSQEIIQTIKTEGTSKIVGYTLLKDYFLPFEILSLLLLGAIMGAAVIARKSDDELYNEISDEQTLKQDGEC